MERRVGNGDNHDAVWKGLTVQHKFGGITRNPDSSYTSRCICGECFTGPARDVEPDIEERKDVAYRLLADHVMPYVRAELERAEGA